MILCWRQRSTPSDMSEAPPLHASESDQRWTFERALQHVCERFPELRERIVRSLRTPQLGAFHNEGKTMESHLRLIVETLNDMALGKFPSELDNEPALRELLERAVVAKDPDGVSTGALHPDMLLYAFTHDIAKPDTLLVKCEGEKKGLEMTLEEWEQRVKGDPPTVDGKIVASIGYYHQSKGEEGQHGSMGALSLPEAVSEHIKTAIKKHEVAYLFAKINALTYEKHFVSSGLNTEEQAAALAASYADVMASLTKDGVPDLSNFICLAVSRENSILVRRMQESGMKVRENDLRHLLSQPRKLSEADVEAIRIG